MNEVRIPMPASIHNFITWLDGCDAAYWSDVYIPETNMRRFEFKPTEAMRWKHQIQDSDYDMNSGRIVKEFPNEYCINASSSAKTIRWFILCDYNGKEVEAIHKFNKDNLIKLQSYKNEIETLNLALLIAQKEAKKREAHRLESDEESLDRFAKIKRITDPLNAPPEEKK